MISRKFNKEKDLKAAHRIWHEVGWIEPEKTKGMDIIVDKGRTLVADVAGQPECLVVSDMGDLKYLDEYLDFSCIAGVTTSLVARKHKLARRVTAERIALDAIDGAAVSGLGMFEQGFYNTLGYGTGGYTIIIKFAPSNLNINRDIPTPVRLSIDDLEKVHLSRMNRMRLHGSCSFGTIWTEATIHWIDNGKGFGFLNDKGELTHHIWVSGIGKENGPYSVAWMAYQNYDQLLDLLALLKSFGEQIYMIRMCEPPQLQFQDFLKKPVTYRNTTTGSEYKNEITASGYWQMRICNLEKCMSKTHLIEEGLKCNLELTDPVSNFLDDDIAWQGLTGNYVLDLGQECSIKAGTDSKLPTLRASIGAFTRMWLGVLPAQSLMVTDDLTAPEPLIKKLGNLFRLPKPDPDWEF